MGILKVSAQGQDAEHELSYSRIDFFSLLAAVVREVYGLRRMLLKKSCLFAPRGSGSLTTWKQQVNLQAPTPNRRKVNIHLVLIFNLACAVLLPVVVFPRFAKDSSTGG